ncbi:MAG: DUF4407 domain-containing protein [Bacteroidota bacterium]
MKKIQEFFWFCAGANVELLRQCPTEQAKYMGIGGTIFFTAVMAGLAGGYAFMSAFDQASLAIPFGIFWGLMIFNLDRYIVASTGKGDGTIRITWMEWKNAFPRLLMALLLGFVIATPLELRLFEKEIDMEIETLKQQKRAEARDQVEVNYNEMGELELKIISLENDVKVKARARDTKYQEMIAEAEGLSGSGKPGAGKIYRDKKQQYEKIEAEYQELKSAQEKKIDRLSKRLEDLQQSRDEEVENIANIANQYDGLMAKLEAFGKLTDRYPTLQIAKWLITAMFILIEIAPILFKMMTERGPYDDMTDRIKHVSKLTEMETISKTNLLVQSNLELSKENQQKRVEAELQANDALLKKIAAAQADIAGAAIEGWKNQQMELARENYEDFVSSKKPQG